MVFDELLPAQDFFYLSSLLAGSAIGAGLPYVFLHRTGARTFRGIVSSTLFTGAVGFLCAAFIAGGFDVFADLDTAAVAFILFFFSFCGALLPRFLGFPVLVGALSAIVLFSWSFLVFPPSGTGGPLGRIRVNADGDSRLWFDNHVSPDIIFTVSDPTLLRFDVIRIDFKRQFPLLGGSSRAALLALRLDSKTLGRRQRHSLLDLIGEQGKLAIAIVPGMTVSLLSLSPGDGDIHPGVRLDIFLSEGGLRFSGFSVIK